MQIKVSNLVFFIACFSLFTGCDEQREALEAEIKTSSIIIGTDDRRAVTGNYSIQNRTVGQLIAYYDDRKRIHRCSATVIKDNYIITAAHCLFNGDQAYTDMYFYPGIRAEHTQPFGRFPVLEAYYPTLYNKTTATTVTVGYDIAVIKVGKNEAGEDLNRQVGGTGWWGPNSLPSNSVNTIGYPGDKPTSQAFFQNDCFVGEFGELSYETQCDVYSGQSGSPILMRHEASNASYIIGVIAAETTDTNLVAKITNERQRIINQIVAGTFSQNRAQFLEKWKFERMPRTNNYNILIKNSCPTTMNVAYYAITKVDQKWQTKGFFEIRPGQTREVGTTPNGVYQLHAHNSRNGKGSLGTNIMKSVPGSSGHFFFDMYSPGKMGDTTFTIDDCRN